MNHSIFDYGHIVLNYTAHIVYSPLNSYFDIHWIHIYLYYYYESNGGVINYIIQFITICCPVFMVNILDICNQFYFYNCITFNSKEQYVLHLINMFMKMNV